MNGPRKEACKQTEKGANAPFLRAPSQTPAPAAPAWLFSAESAQHCAPPEYKPLTAREQGFTPHAATRMAASNPRGLFRLCAYGARGAIASSRLSKLPSGSFAYELKRPLNDGRKTLGWYESNDPHPVQRENLSWPPSPTNSRSRATDARISSARRSAATCSGGCMRAGGSGSGHVHRSAVRRPTLM